MMVMLSPASRGRFPVMGSTLISVMAQFVLKALAAWLLAHDLNTQPVYIAVLSIYTAASLTRQSSEKWCTSCQHLASARWPRLMHASLIPQDGIGFLLACRLAQPCSSCWQEDWSINMNRQEGTGFLLACSFTRLLYSAF